MAKIALYCIDRVGKAMAGPAIRYWEMAQALSRHHDVVLLIPNPCEMVPEHFKLIQSRTLPSDVDVVIIQEISLRVAFDAKRKGIKIILDAYDPVPLELLEIFRSSDMMVRKHRISQAINRFNFSFELADAVICANTKQRDLWMGLLLSLKRLTPKTYDKDVTLRHFIDLVPFGLSSTPPMKSDLSLRKLFNLQSSDKVLLWGGGIWNWFDPLTLIRAIHLLSEKRSDIKLVFMGIKHPNDAVPEMRMATEAVKLAKALNLYDKHVFFNFGWVPYEQRQGFLLESNVGVSLHFEHLETEYAFRTRILDYFWAGLPIIATRGDCFAELIQKEELGFVVPPNDPEASALAIQNLVDDSALVERMKRNIERIRPQFYWEEVVKPIDRMVNHLNEQKAKYSWRDLRSMFSFFMTNRGPLVLLKKMLLRMAFSTRT